MDEGFNILANIPLILLAIVFSFVFILFLRAGFVFLTTRGYPENVYRGRKMLFRAFYGFFGALLLSLVFYSVGYSFKKGAAMPIQGDTADFPASPASNFPPSPNFIKAGGYYFQGPWPLKEYNEALNSATYLVLCKKDSGYDIISAEQADGRKIANSQKYSCWLENCGNNSKNLYAAIFRVHSQAYGAAQGSIVKKAVEEKELPVCSFFEI